MAVLTLPMLPVSVTVDTQGIQKILGVTQVVTPLITEVLPLDQKSKSALVCQNQKKIFFEISPYIVYSKIRMLTFLTEDCFYGQD